MISNPIAIYSAASTTFLASLVEFVEALTIVLAVGATRGWRPALGGAGLGVLSLVLLVLVFGSGLEHFPFHDLQFIIGACLLLFGLWWLKKAVLRAAGARPLHDEDKIFAAEKERLMAAPSLLSDPMGMTTAFKAVVLEGIEVVFIVIATGETGHALLPAAMGAALAGLTVIGLGLLLHRPLSRVPENSLKLVVGIMLAAFGTFWIGESLGYPWPAKDLSIFGLAMLWGVTALFAIALLKKRSRREVR